jgi:hypothetical protein
MEQVDIGGRRARLILGARNNLDDEDGAPDRRHRVRRADLDDLARLHPLPHDGQPDLAGLEVNRGASTLFGDGQHGELTNGEQGLASHQDVHEGAFLGADPVLHEDVVAHLEGEGLRGSTARHGRLTDECAHDADARLLLGQGISRYTADKSQDRQHSDRTPHAHGFLLLSGYRAMPPAFVAVSTS